MRAQKIVDDVHEVGMADLFQVGAHPAGRFVD